MSDYPARAGVVDSPQYGLIVSLFGGRVSHGTQLSNSHIMVSGNPIPEKLTVCKQ